MVWAPRQFVQAAYVCRNLERGIGYFIDKQGAGPFHAFDMPANEVELTYRGGKTHPRRTRIAFGYRGPVQFELFETDNQLYSHVLGDRDIAYHHCIQVSDRFREDIDGYAQAGFKTLGVARGPGVAIHYIDTWEAIGHYTEVFDYDTAIAETGGAMFKLFEIMHKSSLDWDGKDPIRPLPALPL